MDWVFSTASVYTLGCGYANTCIAWALVRGRWRVSLVVRLRYVIVAGTWTRPVWATAAVRSGTGVGGCCTGTGLFG